MVRLVLVAWLALIGAANADSSRIILDCDRAQDGTAPADWCFHLSARSTPARDGLIIMVAHFNASPTVELDIYNGSKLLRRCIGIEVNLCSYTWPKAQMAATQDFTLLAVMANGSKLYSYGKLKRP